MFEARVGQPFSIVVPGEASYPVAVLREGEVVPPSSVTVTEVTGSSVSAIKVSFTPATTGVYAILYGSYGVTYVKVSTKTLYEKIDNLEDTALGSWTWSKDTSVLTLLRQDGSTLASFIMKDSQTSASREMLPD